MTTAPTWDGLREKARDETVSLEVARPLLCDGAQDLLTDDLCAQWALESCDRPTVECIVMAVLDDGEAPGGAKGAVVEYVKNTADVVEKDWFRDLLSIEGLGKKHPQLSGCLEVPLALFKVRPESLQEEWVRKLVTRYPTGNALRRCKMHDIDELLRGAQQQEHRTVMELILGTFFPNNECVQWALRSCNRPTVGRIVVAALNEEAPEGAKEAVVEYVKKNTGDVVGEDWFLDLLSIDRLEMIHPQLSGCLEVPLVLFKARSQSLQEEWVQELVTRCPTGNDLRRCKMRDIDELLKDAQQLERRTLMDLILAGDPLKRDLLKYDLADFADELRDAHVATSEMKVLSDLNERAMKKFVGLRPQGAKRRLLIALYREATRADSKEEIKQVPTGELASAISGGDARRAVQQLPMHEFNAKHKTRPVLAPLEGVQWALPSSAAVKETFTVYREDAAETVEECINSWGYSVAAKGPAGPLSLGVSYGKTEEEAKGVQRQQVSKSFSQFYNHFVPMKVLKLDKDLLSLSGEAKDDAQGVKGSEEKARAFLVKYGTHINTNPYTVGGVLSEVTTIEYDEAVAIEELKKAGTRGGGVSGGVPQVTLEIGAKQEHVEHRKQTKRVVKGEKTKKVITMGPSVEDKSEFVNQLQSGNWRIIDRSFNPAGMWPVWELVAAEGMEEAARALQAVWAGDALSEAAREGRDFEKQEVVRYLDNLLQARGGSALPDVWGHSFAHKVEGEVFELPSFRETVEKVPAEKSASPLAVLRKWVAYSTYERLLTSLPARLRELSKHESDYKPSVATPEVAKLLNKALAYAADGEEVRQVRSVLSAFDYNFRMWCFDANLTRDALRELADVLEKVFERPSLVVGSRVRLQYGTGLNHRCTGVVQEVLPAKFKVKCGAHVEVYDGWQLMPLGDLAQGEVDVNITAPTASRVVMAGDRPPRKMQDSVRLRLGMVYTNPEVYLVSTAVTDHVTELISTKPEKKGFNRKHKNRDGHLESEGRREVRIRRVEQNAHRGEALHEATTHELCHELSGPDAHEVVALASGLVEQQLALPVYLCEARSEGQEQLPPNLNLLRMGEVLHFADAPSFARGLGHLTLRDALLHLPWVAWVCPADKVDGCRLVNDVLDGRFPAVGQGTVSGVTMDLCVCRCEGFDGNPPAPWVAVRVVGRGSLADDFVQEVLKVAELAVVEVGKDTTGGDLKGLSTCFTEDEVCFFSTDEGGEEAAQVVFSDGDPYFLTGTEGELKEELRLQLGEYTDPTHGGKVGSLLGGLTMGGLVRLEGALEGAALDDVFPLVAAHTALKHAERDRRVATAGTLEVANGVVDAALRLSRKEEDSCSEHPAVGALLSVLRCAERDERMLGQRLLAEKLGGEVALETVWRELALLYTCRPEVYKTAPVLAARALVDGGPLELVDGESCSVVLPWVREVVQEADRLLSERLGREPRIAIFSVAGVQSTGKSTLLNTMTGTRLRTGVGATTRGINMSLVAAEGVGWDYTVLLDAEGVCNPEHRNKPWYESHNNFMAVHAMLLPHVCLLTNNNEDATKAQDLVETAVGVLNKTTAGIKAAGLPPRKLFFVFNNMMTVAAVGSWQEVTKHVKDNISKYCCKNEDGLQIDTVLGDGDFHFLGNKDKPREYGAKVEELRKARNKVTAGDVNLSKWWDLCETVVEALRTSLFSTSFGTIVELQAAEARDLKLAQLTQELKGVLQRKCKEASDGSAEGIDTEKLRAETEKLRAGTEEKCAELKLEWERFLKNDTSLNKGTREEHLEKWKNSKEEQMTYFIEQLGETLEQREAKADLLGVFDEAVKGECEDELPCDADSAFERCLGKYKAAGGDKSVRKQVKKEWDPYFAKYGDSAAGYPTDPKEWEAFEADLLRKAQGKLLHETTAVNELITETLKWCHTPGMNEAGAKRRGELILDKLIGALEDNQMMKETTDLRRRFDALLVEHANSLELGKGQETVLNRMVSSFAKAVPTYCKASYAEQLAKEVRKQQWTYDTATVYKHMHLELLRMVKRKDKRGAVEKMRNAAPHYLEVQRRLLEGARPSRGKCTNTCRKEVVELLQGFGEQCGGVSGEHLGKALRNHLPKGLLVNMPALDTMTDTSVLMKGLLREVEKDDMWSHISYNSVGWEEVRKLLCGAGDDATKPRCTALCPMCGATCGRSAGHDGRHSTKHLPQGMVHTVSKSKVSLEWCTCAESLKEGQTRRLGKGTERAVTPKEDDDAKHRNYTTDWDKDFPMWERPTESAGSMEKDVRYLMFRECPDELKDVYGNDGLFTNMRELWHSRGKSVPETRGLNEMITLLAIDC